MPGRRSIATPVLMVVLLGLTLLPAGAAEPLPTDTDVDYQLGGAVSPAANVGVVVRDRRAAPVSGRYNVCYVNGFQTQPHERTFWRGRMSLVLHHRGKPVVDEAWGEWLLDLRTPAKRKRLATIVDRWADGCAKDGYQAVEFDNLDSFTRSRGLITRSQALTYARLLVRSAHSHGLAAGQKNLAGFDGRRLGYDFAVSEECGRYRECAAYVDDFGDQVVMVEYRATDFQRACASYGATHAIVLRDRDLSPRGVREWC